jgi:hypothetical protein
MTRRARPLCAWLLRLAAIGIVFTHNRLQHIFRSYT